MKSDWHGWVRPCSYSMLQIILTVTSVPPITKTARKTLTYEIMFIINMASIESFSSGGVALTHFTLVTLVATRFP